MTSTQLMTTSLEEIRPALHNTNSSLSLQKHHNFSATTIFSQNMFVAKALHSPYPQLVLEEGKK